MMKIIKTITLLRKKLLANTLTRLENIMSTGSAILAAIFVVTSMICTAQSTSGGSKSVVPTTKILAIGRVATPLTAEQRATIMPREVPDTVRLYLDGKIDQWYVRQDGKGVVFLLNLTSVEEAHALLEKLPLGQAKLMEFDLMPLGPLNPLRVLLPKKE
jgi:hypothetical protein